MDAITFAVPQSLGMPRILEVCRDLNTMPMSAEYILDFSHTQHFEPFGMLMLGSAIRRLRERNVGDGQNPAVYVSGKSLDIQGHNYAHRLGFWWSIGDESNLPTVSRTATATTIPITRLSYAELFRKAGFRDPVRAEEVSASSAELATTLSGSDEQSPLWLALEYCFREMIRNAFEHGRTDSVWFTGATRPQKDDVQIAIVDAGRGIRQSLSDNPDQRYFSDAEAIRAALRPGVSRNAKRSRSEGITQKLLEDFPGQDPSLYDNSGFGLTLTSHLARDAGQFAIISGDASVAYVGGSELNSTTIHNGTAVRIVLHPSKVPGVLERVLVKADGTPRSGSLMSASMMTRLGLKRSTKQVGDDGASDGG